MEVSEREEGGTTTGGGGGAAAIDTKAAVAKDSVCDVSMVLFKDDIEVGTRGDIIQFYNKIFIGYVKDFVLKFNPDEVGSYISVVCVYCVLCVCVCVCVCVQCVCVLCVSLCVCTVCVCVCLCTVCVLCVYCV